MKLKKKPTDPEVMARILKRIKEMTSDEAIAFLTYRTPGIKVTDMTGMFREHPETKCADQDKSSS